MADKKKDEKKKSPVPPPIMYGSDLERARDLKAGTALDTADFDTRFKNADVKKRKEMMAGGGSVKKYKKGGSVSSCSKRADGVATKGKTRGKMV
jgi:hypothetical protein